MRYRLVVSTILLAVTISFSHSEQAYAYESPTVLDFYANYFPRLTSIPGRPYQSALKIGDDIGHTALYIKSPNGEPKISVDLSELGIPHASTTQDKWLLYGPITYNGQYPTYLFVQHHLRVGNLSDGIKTSWVTATDALGIATTSTFQVVVDNTEPILKLEDISFSKVSPQNGDTMYLSGVADGTGSRLTVYEIFETLWDIDGNPIWAPGHGAPYERVTLNSAIASSSDGTFNRVAIGLLDSKSEPLKIAHSFRLDISAYDGSGHIVKDSLTVTIPRDPCVAAGNCVSNILFLPGIESSRLYRPDYSGGTDKLWEPNIDSDVKDLYMNSDGSSNRFDVYTKERDVLDELPNGANIYKSFIGKMNDLKNNNTITNWEPIAYDWRLSLDDILQYGHNINGRIYYSGDLRATSTPYIIQELKRLAETSLTGKVTIVAHSNGGLLAKRLTQILGPAETSRLIDKMIFVAVPQAGTPVAIPAILHGEGQEHGLGFITSKQTARTLTQNSPMAYNLLPSAQYFTHIGDPVVTFDSSLTDWISRYGASIHSQESLQTFLTDSFGRVDAQTGDISQPILENHTLLSNAKILHASLDTWITPAGIKLIQIAGWGIPKTVQGITYKKKGTGVEAGANFTIDGDGTVVTPSALWTSTTTGAENYWVDLKSYNSLTERILEVHRKTDHSSILEINEILTFIADNLLAKVSHTLPKYIYTSVPPAEIGDVRLRYALHSPLTLNLYDDSGRHTGVSTTTGRIEEQIPGTYYTEFGDVKYIFSDASTAARLLMDGYDSGLFTLNVDQYVGDTRTASTTFKDIPTTPNTTVSLDVQSDISTLSPMSIDKDGDGTTDFVLTSKPNDTVTFDTIPPEIQIAFSTTTRAVVFTGLDDSGTTTISIAKRTLAFPNVGMTVATASDLAGNTTVLTYTDQLIQNMGVNSITLWSVAYNGATTTVPRSSLLYRWGNKTDGSFNSFTSTLRTATTTIVSTYNPMKNNTLITQSKKQTLPGMVVPYMTTSKGSLIISY